MPDLLGRPEAQQWFALMVSAIACGTDIRVRRIPNIITFGGAAGALVFALVAGRPEGVVDRGARLAGGPGGLHAFLSAQRTRRRRCEAHGVSGAWLGPAGAMWTALYGQWPGGAMAILTALASNYFQIPR